MQKWVVQMFKRPGKFQVTLHVLIAWAAAGTVGAFAAEKQYCPVPDFIEICLEQDQTGIAAGKRMAAKGWGFAYDEPDFVHIANPHTTHTTFSISETTYSDSFAQKCRFDYWRLISTGRKAYCSSEEFATLDAWFAANDGKLILESHQPHPQFPNFTKRSLTKIWNLERGVARMSAKLGADEFYKGKPLVATVLVIEKTFLSPRTDD